MTKRRGHLLETDKVLATILISPTGLWMISIILYPILLVFWQSLYNQSAIESSSSFIQFRNYNIVIREKEFWNAAAKTIYWTVFNMIVIVPSGFLCALFLNRETRGFRSLQTWFLFPWVFPIVASILMWRWILDPVAGVLNSILIASGIIEKPLSLFAKGSTAMSTVVLVNAWRWIPFVTIMDLAALKTVPTSLFDAARIDGASNSQLLIHVIFPSVATMVFNTSFILLLWLFNMFPPIWLMTQGGPGDATTTLPILIYKEGIQLFRIGRASTISILLLILFVLPFTILYIRFFSPRRS